MIGTGITKFDLTLLPYGCLWLTNSSKQHIVQQKGYGYNYKNPFPIIHSIKMFSFHSICYFDDFAEVDIIIEAVLRGAECVGGIICQPELSKLLQN